MAKATAAKKNELPDSMKKAAEEEGYEFVERTAELSKWDKGVTVQGTFTGFKQGKKFSGKSEASNLIKFRADGKTLVYACPAVLYQIFEDIEPGSNVMVVCLGQTLKIKDRKELAWDFEVAVKK